ncbi:Immunoglobulin, partial [Oryctes borbonicus]
VTYQVSSLKITDLRVPLKASHDALLDCRYDLEGDLLYDVKWYKDGQEFFRCTPGKAQEFPTDGIRIYFDQFPSIGSCSFRLTNLISRSEGEYKCEVSSEGPKFKTAAAYSRLKVVPASQGQDRNKDGADEMRTTSGFYQESNTTWNAYSSRGTTAHIWRR